MCGRYTLIAEQTELDREFHLIVSGPSYARYNIAPTQLAPIVRMSENGTRRLDECRWGLIPFWSKYEKIGSRLINARSEEAASKPSFRSPMKKQRCLVPTSGFYEWKEIEGGTKSKPAKQPFYIRQCDDRLFAFAGLWDRWLDPDGNTVESFTILTTAPNDLMRSLHNRMPVIVDREHYDRWLDRSVQSVDDLASIMVSYPSAELTAYEISTKVNSPKFDDPACIEPAA